MELHLLSSTVAAVCVRKYFRHREEIYQMIDDRSDSTHIVDNPEVNLPPPRFDERAAANAQPVKPIRTSRISALAASLRHVVTNGSRAFVLVVIAGLATVRWLAWHG